MTHRRVRVPAYKVRYMLTALEKLVGKYPDAYPSQLKSRLEKKLGETLAFARFIRGLQVLSEERPSTKPAVDAIFSRTDYRDLVFKFKEYEYED